MKAALEENDALRARLAQLEQASVCNKPENDEDNHQQDIQNSPVALRDDSNLLATMNNWTLSTINIPECTPSDGETDIDKSAFEYWKDTFISSIKLVNSTDEDTLFGLFKVKAGPKLREIYQTTVTTIGMSSEITSPFSNAMERLDEYFGSRTYILAQRGKLMNMTQTRTETSIQFVRRVGTAAKLCNYTEDEEMEAVVRVLTKGALDGRVRVLAHRNWVKEGSMKDLIDLVRDRELEKANEDEFQRSHTHKEMKTIAAFSQYTNEAPNQFRGNWHQNSEHWRYGVRGRQGSNRGRGRGMSNRGSLNNRSSGSVGNCWRCGSVYHQPSNCPVIQKVCRNCGGLGHIARVCSKVSEQVLQSGPRKRRNDHKEEVNDLKIAVIEKNGEMKDEVREDIDDLS